MTARFTPDRRTQVKLTLEEAERRLCETLEYTASGKGFYATLAAALEEVKLNPTQAAYCLRVGFGLSGCTHLELNGCGAYANHVKEPTLHALINLLTIAKGLTAAEWDDIQTQFDGRSTITNVKPTTPLNKSLAEFVSAAIIAKCPNATPAPRAANPAM